MLPNYINIDRVHEVLDGKRLGRGAGFTTANFVVMITAISLESNYTVAYISSTHNVSEMNKRNFSKLLTECGIDHKIVSDRVTLGNGSHVKFIPSESVERYMRGATIMNYYIDNSITEQNTIDHIHRRMATRSYI